MALTNEFVDWVTDFGTQTDFVNVLFARHAAGYVLRVENSNFTEIVGQLAAAWKSKAAVNVVVDGTVIIALQLANEE